MLSCSPLFSFFFFFNDTATTEIYTLSLHDALPICLCFTRSLTYTVVPGGPPPTAVMPRSEEHTSELQSPCNLVCRLLLEKKKKKKHHISHTDKLHNIKPSLWFTASHASLTTLAEIL